MGKKNNEAMPRLKEVFERRPEVAAIAFGLAIFIFLAVCFGAFFELFWGLMKNDNPLSYLLPPLFILQLPGFLLVNFLPIQHGGFEDVQMWLLSSFLSAIFWSVSVYFIVLLQKRWRD